MDHFIIDVIGYAAAVITNISVYPQAFKVNKILTNQNFNLIVYLYQCIYYNHLGVYYG